MSYPQIFGPAGLAVSRKILPTTGEPDHLQTIDRGRKLGLKLLSRKLRSAPLQEDCVTKLDI